MIEQRAGTLELLAGEIAKAVQPLQFRLADGEIEKLFGELGLQFPSGILAANTQVASAISQIIGVVRSLASLVPQLINAIENEDIAVGINTARQIIDAVRTLVTQFQTLATALNSVANHVPGLNPADILAFAADLPDKLFEYMLVTYLESYYPTAFSVLVLIGIIDIARSGGAPADPTKPPFVRKRLALNNITELFTSPQALFRSLYGWGDPGFDGQLILERLNQLLYSLFVPSLYTPGPSPSIQIFWFTLKPKTDVSPPGLELILSGTFSDGITMTIPFTILDNWSLEFSARGGLNAGLSAVIQPPFSLSITPPAGSLTGDAILNLAGGNPSRPYLLLGQSDASRVEVGRIKIGGGGEFHWDSAGNTAKGSAVIELAIEKGKIVISTSGSDGFLNSILPSDGLSVDLDMIVGWTGSGGLYFRGSAALEIALPIHLELGPIHINTVYIIIGLSSNGGIKIELSTEISAQLGPLAAVIERMGANAELTFPGKTGNMAPLNLNFGFKPPNGIGLAIDAAVVKGGGYLYFDFEKEEYAGILQLSIANVVTVTAIGLVTTRMPDGSKGFSLLIIITAEFATGIQLGFGFTLLGVGGLLGLNRTMRLQALAEGVRSGALNNIMFPHNVIANAPRIISDLRNFFPPENGKFLIGPMVKIGWGTPTLISLSLGIIIEIPGNIAIVGVLSLALPTKDAALLILQVSFIGAIEFDKKRVWFFATLFESRVLYFPLEGEMGLLMAFGDDAVFVLAVGGFHPRFNPPPLPFPSPIRVSFSILSTPTARIRVEGYFAVTSNTVQTGAHAELVFGLDDFGIEGHIGFDVLIQFSPFYLIAEISASVSLNAFGVGMFSIRLRFTLEGPTPWRARGSGSISLLFFEISADFDVTWGETRDTTLPPIPVIPLLKAEFDKIENWRAELPSANNLLVSLRKLDSASEALVLHPVGTLRVSQRAVPLDLGIDKVGTQKPSDANRFTIEILTTSGLGKQDDAVEQFAIAQFQNMDDATKLSRPAFQPQTGGVRLSVAGQQLNSSHVVKRIARYEQIIIDNNFKRYVRRFTIFASSLFAHFLAGASVSKSTLSQHHAQKLQPFSDKVKVAAENYAVVFQANNQLINQTATFSSEAAARDFLQQVATKDPSQAEEMHVIPQFEAMP